MSEYCPRCVIVLMIKSIFDNFIFLYVIQILVLWAQLYFHFNSYQIALQEKPTLNRVISWCIRQRPASDPGSCQRLSQPDLILVKIQQRKVLSNSVLQTGTDTYRCQHDAFITYVYIGVNHGPVEFTILRWSAENYEDLSLSCHSTLYFYISYFNPFLLDTRVAKRGEARVFLVATNRTYLTPLTFSALMTGTLWPVSW